MSFQVICRPSSNQQTERSSPCLRLQEVTTNAYFIFTEGIFDYEETHSANVEIICTDYADSRDAQDRILRITVAIGDANDHYPEFGVPEFFAKLPEHSPQGTRVAQIIASDSDSGIYARISYSFVNNSVGGRCNIQEILHIDSLSGLITVKDSTCLDREDNMEIKTFVAAEDGGGLSTSVKLRIQLTDINDNAPFIHIPDILSVSENQPAGVVRCTDIDEESNAIIRLELSNNNTQQVLNAFEIRSDSENLPNSFSSSGVLKGKNDIAGLLVTKKPLDREDIDSYYINIMATDSGTPQKVTFKGAQVRILDENDNAPVLRFPQPDTTIGYHPQVYTNSPHGSKVCILRSYDPDKGENGTVVYALQHNTNGSRYFHLDQMTGKLTTAWHHTGPSSGVYAVRVLLYDMGRRSTRVGWNFFIYISPRNPLLDAVQLSKSSSTWQAGNSTVLAKSTSRMTHITVIMISVAALIILFLLISCICMIKALLHSKAKASHHNPVQRHSDGMMKEPSTLGMVYTQSSAVIDDEMAVDSLKYTYPAPNNSAWCMRPFGQNEAVAQVTAERPSMDGLPTQAGCETFNRGYYSSFWQNYPLS